MGREETSWGPKLQTKNGKRFPHARGIFANTMQNRQLVCLKRTPINNRKDTPSIPLRGLRAQEKKPKCLLAFQDIWHSCDYIFYSPLKRINWHNIREKNRLLTQQTAGRGLEKAQAFFSVCFFFFMLLFFFFLTYKMCPFALTWANSL